MNKVILIPVFVFFLFDCSNNTNNDAGEIIEINITEALKNRKNLPLSKLVQDVEILKLEANIECFMQNPLLWHFGKKFILAFDDFNSQIFLFDRNGKFIRRIGQAGKGPGEYSGWLLGTMNPSESFIIIVDRIGGRAIVFNTMGEVLAQKELKKHFPSGVIEKVSCAFDNTISIVPGRPATKLDGFSSLVLFDFNLNKIGEVLPRDNDKELAYANIAYQNLFSDGEGAFFWETYNDTVYQYYKDGSSKPKIRYIIEKNGLTRDALTSKEFSDIYDHNLIMSTNFLPAKIVSWVLTPNINFIPVFYDFKTNESYSIERNTTCLDADYKPEKKTNSIENDMYGFEPPLLFNYIPDQKLCVQQFEWGVVSRYGDLDCIRRLEVSHPELRDQLLNYCENPSDDLGMVLILMHMK